MFLVAHRHESLHGTKPDLQQYSVFGSLCFASTLKANHSKFDPRARKCIFLGFKVGMKGFVVYDLHSHTVFVSRDVHFHERILPLIPSTEMPCVDPSPTISQSFPHPDPSPPPSPLEAPSVPSN